MCDGWEIKLTLKSPTKSCDDILNLTFYIAVVNHDPMQYDCTITTIDLKGKPVAEGTELNAKPTIAYEDGFTTVKDNQMWKLNKARVIVGYDENEDVISLSEVVLKSTGEGVHMAKATVGEDDKKLLMT